MRYQKGSLIARESNRGPRETMWVARWVEDFIKDGITKRVHRSQKLGLQREMSKDEAERRLDKILWPLNHGDGAPKEMVSFVAFHQRWERDLLPALKDSTSNFYRQNAKYYVLPYFKDKQLRDITPLLVQQLINQYKGKSKSLLAHIRSTLNKLFKTAVKWHYLDSNPADGLTVPDGEDPVRANVYSPEQVRLLLSKLITPEREMVLLGIAACLRPSELFAVKWGDISENGVYIQRRLYRRKIGNPKTKHSTRLIPLDPAVLAELNKLRKEPDQFVFASPSGKTMRGDEIISRIRMVTAKLELPRFRWHSLRRTGESLLHAAKTPIKDQMAMLGHTNPAITMLYAESSEAGKVEASKTLGDALCLNLTQAPGRVA